ncbi:MAG: formate/nitrite transporter family protein [Bacilli bacterium]|nr:formate/nitrite transporter family protein [Bacilli bacterium]
MKRFLNIMISAFLAGIFIGIGATVFLWCLPTSKIAGTIFFGFGLYGIIQWGFFLYTGKVGLVLDNKPAYLFDLLIGVICNFIGIALFAFVVSLTRAGDTLKPIANDIVNTKQGDSWYSILILSICCGFMIYLAVKGHALIDNPFGKVVIVFFAVSIFILCGFEHCVANIAYYVYARHFSWKAVLYFVIMIIGNGIGSILLDGIIKLFNKTKVAQ